jgi:hypothetical protein
LFEKDKLLFAFTLELKLRLDAGAVGQQELRFLMTGGWWAACLLVLPHLPPVLPVCVINVYALPWKSSNNRNIATNV